MPTAQQQRQLIPPPEQLQLPIRVPVEAELAGAMLRAEVLGSTSHVLLLQALDHSQQLPALGTPVRLKLDWDRQTVNGRLAALGVQGRFLISLGERAIRGSRRVAVDLLGIARSSHQDGGSVVRITDLSAGGARVEGVDLPVGSEVQLQFTPPAHSEAINVLGFVVRSIPGADEPGIGIAFCLVQPSMQVLGSGDWRS
jgi:hypothetical protein